MPTAYLRRVSLKASLCAKHCSRIASRVTIMMAGNVLALVIAGLPAAVSGDGGDPSLIHACVNKITGLVRIIGATKSCTALERPAHWRIAGPAGEVCPSGQFVTGFDSAGQIICGSLCPSQDAQATLAFESGGIDLETRAVVRGNITGSFPPEVDFRFAFNSTRPNPIVLFQERRGAEIAFLDGTPFDTVGCSVVGTLTFTENLIDVPFDFDDTVVIRTTEGNVFKIGRPVNNGNASVTFSYAKLQ